MMICEGIYGREDGSLLHITAGTFWVSGVWDFSCERIEYWLSFWKGNMKR